MSDSLFLDTSRSRRRYPARRASRRQKTGLFVLHGEKSVGKAHTVNMAAKFFGMKLPTKVSLLVALAVCILVITGHATPAMYDWVHATDPVLRRLYSITASIWIAPVFSAILNAMFLGAVLNDMRPRTEKDELEAKR